MYWGFTAATGGANNLQQFRVNSLGAQLSDYTICQDDTVQIQKDEEEAAKLKKDDKEKASAEKEKTDDIEKTKSAADATRATAKPKKGKDIANPGDKNIGFLKSKYEESFKSDYKNYF